MNFIKTTALLTILTLVVLFTAASLGFDLVSSLVFAFLFNFVMYFYSGSLAIKSTRAVKIEDGQFPEVKEIIYLQPKDPCEKAFHKMNQAHPLLSS